jgi:hypothetical protein
MYKHPIGHKEAPQVLEMSYICYSLHQKGFNFYLYLATSGKLHVLFWALLGLYKSKKDHKSRNLKSTHVLSKPGQFA